MMSKPRVLYLEDDETLGALTSNLLGQAGFAVDWERNGEAGMLRFGAASYDLCIVDIMMPRLDGYNFVITLRRQSSRIPVIFLSARVLTEDILRGFAIGGDDYMRKPFSVDELIARMRRLLGQRVSDDDSATRVVTIGRYTFHPQVMELRLNGQTTQLSPRASELLQRMVSSRDRVLPKRETLLERMTAAEDLGYDDSYFPAAEDTERDPHISVDNPSEYILSHSPPSPIAHMSMAGQSCSASLVKRAP